MAQPNKAEVVHAIAAETNTPEETVAKMYEETWDDYRADARILDYVPLFVAKKVRETLRHSHTRSAK
ncbi:DUF3562 domain-containing protein [Paraburkholderia kururiensis]|uniref:DUF3562 domain-containing protein n=1 Tax=Paraburkholderia kururiensis TaxID=984307 RepID=A0ABZ0WKU3_9BURK|nr:DUF3562 domain-containing protein [Paraburkholderia kururiensis]WQD77982.1 DUF3562 domain-containing protein [Paraburkholderia kururiensis]